MTGLLFPLPRSRALELPALAPLLSRCVPGAKARGWRGGCRGGAPGLQSSHRRRTHSLTRRPRHPLSKPVLPGEAAAPWRSPHRHSTPSVKKVTKVTSSGCGGGTEATRRLLASKAQRGQLGRLPEGPPHPSLYTPKRRKKNTSLPPPFFLFSLFSSSFALFTHRFPHQLLPSHLPTTPPPN